MKWFSEGVCLTPLHTAPFTSCQVSTALGHIHRVIDMEGPANAMDQSDGSDSEEGAPSTSTAAAVGTRRSRVSAEKYDGEFPKTMKRCERGCGDRGGGAWTWRNLDAW